MISLLLFIVIAILLYTSFKYYYEYKVEKFTSEFYLKLINSAMANSKGRNGEINWFLKLIEEEYKKDEESYSEKDKLANIWILLCTLARAEVYLDNDAKIVLDEHLVKDFAYSWLSDPGGIYRRLNRNSSYSKDLPKLATKILKSPFIKLFVFFPELKFRSGSKSDLSKKSSNIPDK